MYTDDDQFSDSDSEPCPPQIEKRQYHNLLERNRRNILKYSFAKLKNAIPSFARKNSRASRAKILKRSIDFIHRSRSKKLGRDQDLKELKADNKTLEEQIQAMQAAKESTDLSSVQALLQKINETEFKQHEEEPTDSEDDVDDSDEAANEMENDPEAVYSEDEYDPNTKKAKMNWSSEDWDDVDEVEEPPEPQVSWSVSVTESESESDDTSDSEDTTD